MVMGLAVSNVSSMKLQTACVIVKIAGDVWLYHLHSRFAHEHLRSHLVNPF
jgi:hypothetical protein